MFCFCHSTTAALSQKNEFWFVTRLTNFFLGPSSHCAVALKSHASHLRRSCSQDRVKPPQVEPVTVERRITNSVQLISGSYGGPARSSRGRCRRPALHAVPSSVHGRAATVAAPARRAALLQPACTAARGGCQIAGVLETGRRRWSRPALVACLPGGKREHAGRAIGGTARRTSRAAS